MSTQTLPLYVQIQNFIRANIASGRFTNGDRLPSEPELAQRFATTRSTVAKALQQLVFEGIISRRTGSGTYVGSSQHEDRVDTTELASYEEHVLASGESLQYELLTFQLSPINAQVAQRLELPLRSSAYKLERLRLVAGSPAAVEVRFIAESIARDIDQAWLRTQTVQAILQEHLRLRIGRIENAISATTATERFGKMLNVHKGGALLVREHTIFSAEGRPLLHGKAMYPGDFRIHYTLHSAQSR